ncbi:MAG: hypothetical protein HY881_25030 [Deltaproteobacteria bacterium]|nr:hypothetical protein [Deltaproteobacteria bacterium]
MMKKQQKRNTCLAVVICFLFVIGTWVFSDYGAAKSIHSADNGLSGISQVRRTLRAACNKLKTIDSQVESRAILLQESVAESRQALILWQEFRKSYPESAPAVYGQNSNWSRSADDIEQTIQQMIAANLNGDAKKAFSSCGETCQKFVVMNEQAGIELTTDILFQFRKTAKLLMATLRENDSAKIDPIVKTLLSLRDRALADPVDGTGAPVKSQQALKAFSGALDAFAASIQSADKNMLSHRYATMMSEMEATYDLYL